ncbi:MAG: hypothetical protein EU529_17120 [Promethearchaeota archaeon]|nr:MAG: hypothetical protein EU529_17120 [Candidatus Lokiarchaeota archaeon]
MQRKGDKFTQHFSKNKKKQDKKNLEGQKSYRYSEKCGCGSDLIFGKCCYRSDHRIFNLSRYIEKLKNIKLKLNDSILGKFLEDYGTNSEICDIADKLSDDLKIPRFNQIISDIINGWVRIDSSTENFASAIRFEALAIDWTLPGHDKPIIQEAHSILLRKASDRFKKFYLSYSNSQFSYYEVIKVKKAEGSEYNTWILLKEKFTHKKYVIKDPLICSKVFIWDIIIGRLYRIEGFNLFSTSVFILNPEQQKHFNRILFMFWLKDMIAKRPKIMRTLESSYPDLKRDFSHIGASFSKEYLYNPQIYAFLKQNSSILIEIMNLTNQIAPKYPFIVKSPDKQDIIFAECVGELKSDKIIEAVNILRSDIKYFKEVPEMDKPYKFSFDYLIPNVETPVDEEIINYNITPGKLVNLSKEGIVHKIHELFQKTILFGATSIMSDSSIEQQLESVDNFHSGPKIRLGFAEIKKNQIRLVTYSKTSMEKLFTHIKKILKDFLLQLSFPIYDDLLGKSRIESQISEFRQNSLLKEMIQGEDNDLDLVDDLIHLSDLSFDYDDEDDEEEEDLQLISRMMRNSLMKRWINQKIPLLGGKSPKESINDPKNVLLLIDLIKEIENRDDRKGQFDSNCTYSDYLGINLAQFDKKIQ